MTRWIAPGLILAVLLLLLLRVGVKARRDAAGTALWIKVGLLRIQILPRGKKTEKRPKQDKTGKKKPKHPPQKVEKRDGLAIARALAEIVCRAAGRLKRKICIDEFSLDLVWAASDPASAAIGYGCANAALWSFWPLIENSFHVKKRDLRTGVDFAADAPAVYFRFETALRLGQLLAVAILAGGGALRVYRTYIRQNTRRKAA